MRTLDKKENGVKKTKPSETLNITKSNFIWLVLSGIGIGAGIMIIYLIRTEPAIIISCINITSMIIAISKIYKRSRCPANAGECN